MGKRYRQEIPIVGQSHWCEGRTLLGFKCHQVVRNDSDHCEAGHPNRLRHTNIAPTNNSNKSTASPIQDSYDIETARTLLPEYSEIFSGQHPAPGSGQNALPGYLAARIGDPDLDFDITTTIRPVLRHDSPDTVELAIECDRGIGRVNIDNSGPSDRSINAVSILVSYHLPTEDPIVRQAEMAMIDNIVDWGKSRATIRIVGTPGKLPTLYGPNGQVAHLPHVEPEIEIT
jgi:hypothetical protein